jgi:hypothetical protein
VLLLTSGLLSTARKTTCSSGAARLVMWPLKWSTSKISRPSTAPSAIFSASESSSTSLRFGSLPSRAKNTTRCCPRTDTATSTSNTRHTKPYPAPVPFTLPRDGPDEKTSRERPRQANFSHRSSKPRFLHKRRPLQRVRLKSPNHSPSGVGMQLSPDDDQKRRSQEEDAA